MSEAHDLSCYVWGHKAAVQYRVPSLIMKAMQGLAF